MTEAEYKRIIKDPDRWVMISGNDYFRSYELQYPGSLYRQDKKKNDGTWKRDFYYTISRSGVSRKLSIVEAARYLEWADKEMERRRRP